MSFLGPKAKEAVATAITLGSIGAAHGFFWYSMIKEAQTEKSNPENSPKASPSEKPPAFEYRRLG